MFFREPLKSLLKVEVNYIPDILNEPFFGPIILTCQYPIGGLKHFCFESFGETMAGKTRYLFCMW